MNPVIINGADICSGRFVDISSKFEDKMIIIVVVSMPIEALVSIMNYLMNNNQYLYHYWQNMTALLIRNGYNSKNCYHTQEKTITE